MVCGCVCLLLHSRLNPFKLYPFHITFFFFSLCVLFSLLMIFVCVWRWSTTTTASRHSGNPRRAGSLRSGHGKAVRRGARPEIWFRRGLLQGIDILVAKHETANLVAVRRAVQFEFSKGNIELHRYIDIIHKTYKALHMQCTQSIRHHTPHTRHVDANLNV